MFDVSSNVINFNTPIFDISSHMFDLSTNTTSIFSNNADIIAKQRLFLQADKKLDVSANLLQLKVKTLDVSGNFRLEGNSLMTGHLFKTNYKDISLNASNIFDISARLLDISAVNLMLDVNEKFRYKFKLFDLSSNTINTW